MIPALSKYLAIFALAACVLMSARCLTAEAPVAQQATGFNSEEAKSEDSSSQSSPSDISEIEAIEGPPERPRGLQQGPSERGSEPQSVIITRDELGRLVIMSEDTQALDRLEALIARLAPRPKDYRIFYLKHAGAGWVSLQLEAFFEQDGQAPPAPQHTRLRRLSWRRPLKFLSEMDTNTILVQGADPAQLRTIAELIELYDVPQPTDSGSARHTKMFQIQHSKATMIAATLKEVYRDLLSSSDRALRKHNASSAKSGSGYEHTVIYAGSGDEQSAPKSGVHFKGALSIGVEELSNTLIVSAGQNLLENIELLIGQLDQAAQQMQSAFQVVRVSRFTNTDRLQKSLNELVGSKARNKPKKPGGLKPRQARPGDRQKPTGKQGGRNSSEMSVHADR